MNRRRAPGRPSARCSGRCTCQATSETRAERGRREEPAPIGEIAPARALGPHTRVSEHHDRQQRAEHAVPEQHRVARETNPARGRPPDAADQHRQHEAERHQAAQRATITAHPRAYARQHTAQLEHQQDRECDARERVRTEHPRATRGPGKPGRQAARETERHNSAKPQSVPRGVMAPATLRSRDTPALAEIPDEKVGRLERRPRQVIRSSARRRTGLATEHTSRERPDASLAVSRSTRPARSRSLISGAATSPAQDEPRAPGRRAAGLRVAEPKRGAISDMTLARGTRRRW